MKKDYNYNFENRIASYSKALASSNIEISKCKSSDLKKYPVVNGRVYQTTDTNEFYYGVNGKLKPLDIFGSDSDIMDTINKIKADIAKLDPSKMTSLENKVNAAVSTVNTLKTNVNSAVSQAKAAASQAQAAASAVANKASTSDVTTALSTAESYTDTKVTALSSKYEAKGTASSLINALSGASSSAKNGIFVEVKSEKGAVTSVAVSAPNFNSLYDSMGAASDALSAAQSYTDTSISNLTSVFASTYASKGDVTTAVTEAEGYADTKVTALSSVYDEKGAADSVFTSAKNYTDSQISNATSTFASKGDITTALSDATVSLPTSSITDDWDVASSLPTVSTDGYVKANDVIAFIEAAIKKKSEVDGSESETTGDTKEYFYMSAVKYGETLTPIYTMNCFEITEDLLTNGIEVASSHELAGYNAGDDPATTYAQVFAIDIPDGYKVTSYKYDTDTDNGSYLTDPESLMVNPRYATKTYGSKTYNCYQRLKADIYDDAQADLEKDNSRRLIRIEKNN